MKQTLRQELARHKLLLFFSAVSAGLAIALLIFQHYKTHLLELDVKWLFFSSVPILLGLFMGGYIKNFKGFGLEFESNLKEQIPSDFIESELKYKVSEGMNKESIHKLGKLTSIEKNKIDRLKFIFGKHPHYYDSSAIRTHFESLPNLRFVEIVNDKDEFLYLIPIREFKTNSGVDNAKVENFISAIEEKKIEQNFSKAVSDYILKTDSIIQGYRKLNNSAQSRKLVPGKQILPILDSEKKMLGTIDKQKLEAEIAKEVSKTID